jgi:hypothetical protein
VLEMRRANPQRQQLYHTAAWYSHAILDIPSGQSIFGSHICGQSTIGQMVFQSLAHWQWSHTTRYRPEQRRGRGCLSYRRRCRVYGSLILAKLSHAHLLRSATINDRAPPELPQCHYHSVTITVSLSQCHSTSDWTVTRLVDSKLHSCYGEAERSKAVCGACQPNVRNAL